jgi:putative NIF3 family GTP cyclohydrolase 1 type 2
VTPSLRASCAGAVLTFTIGVASSLRATESPRSIAESPRALRVRDIIARIQDHVGIPWRSETVDTVKAGDPETPVTGIAVTMMATQDVLQRAAATGRNLVITHEPTFYGHLDQPDDLEKAGDPVLAAKRAFIAERRLVVWRFHDHWHARSPDGIREGMVRALGWEKLARGDDPFLFTLPETTLDRLAGDLRKKLDVHVLRVVGDRDLKVTKVALSPGAAGSLREIRALERDDVEVLVLGETREWETVEYVADAVAQGKKKGLVILSHIPSEQAGMEECARWLKGFVTEVPVDFVPARDPFWAPR